ncbi:hypothetical protein KUTeg_006765 [Tegillarca granosa]|uniref:protein-tyrosine-phosphatase n=1 Tax=Tegillarca granosa TaxID=220873 RepID=A0ABQ9FB95_TEGGR|nr:hypothetical protein KUTeg_006765 [Tegillarca granosa]
MNTSLTFTWDPVANGSLEYYEIGITPKETSTVSPVCNGFEYFTVPNPPEGLSINASGGRSLDVTWSRPSLGHVERYIVTLYPPTENSSKVQTVTVTSTHYKFTGLHPGQTYRITVVSESGYVQSSAISDYGITFPSTVAELFIDEVGTDSINISWSKPEGTVFDTYRLTIYPAHTTSPISIPQSSGILHHNFVGLNPGTIYNVTVQTIVNHSSSDQAQVTVITIPLPVQDLNASTHDSNSLYVEWRTPAIIQQEFFVVFNDMTANSTWETVNKTTKPKPITNLSAVLVGRNVQLSWQPGNDSMQDHYYIWYRPTLVTFGSTWYQKATTSESYLLTDMFPGQQYEILIFAVSYGEMSSQKTTYVQIQKTNTSSFTLQWIYDANSTYVDHWSVEYQSYNNGPMQSTTVPSMSAGLDDSVIVTLGSLVSGETYKVVIRSIVQNSSSEKVEVNVTIRPNVMTSLSEDVYTTSSAISLTYSAATNFFQYYIFHITNMSSIQPIKKDKSDLNRSILFTGLEGGTLYQVSVVTVSGDQISDPKYINLQTYPNIPHVENTRTPYSINITLNRHKDQGFLDHVVVGCHLNGVSCGTSTQVASSDMSPITAFFDKLTPYTKYAFQIIAVAGSKNDSLYLEIWTLQTAPSAVQNLHAAETNKLTVNLSWSPPLEKNGELTAYLVSYTGVMGGHTDDTGSRNVTVSADMVSQDMSLQFTQLKAGFTYTFQVHAKTITYGEVAKVTLTMKTYAPVFKDGVTVASATPKKITDKSITAVTPSTIVVNFTNAFSDQYGDIIQYTVIVATDTSNKYTDTHVLPGYKAFQNDPSLKAYQAISNCSEFFLQESTCGGKFRIHKRSAVNVEYKVFEIGTEANCKDIYCNGPLRQQTKYFIKLRAYTTGGYSDTEYSEPIITGVVEETVNAAPIVVSILLAVVVIVVAIVIFIIFRRKMREKSNMYRQGNSNILTPRSSLTSSRKNHAVSVMDFREHIKMMSADSDFKYAEEFEEKCDQYWPTGTDAMFYGDLQVAALNETKFPSWSITEFKLSLQQYVCIHQCILCVVDGREDEHIYQNAGVANAAYEVHDKGLVFFSAL